MIIEQKRIKFNSLSTISELRIGGEYICYILEDTDRDLNSDGDLDDVGEGKIYGQTAIPYGTYKVILEKNGEIYEKYNRESFWSGRGQKDFYKIFKGSLLVTGIKGYSRVHIHIGNYVGDTLGCPLTGTTANINSSPFSVSGSTAAYVKLYKKVIPAFLAGEDVYLAITK
jgi:hypothetical protein